MEEWIQRGGCNRSCLNCSYLSRREWFEKYYDVGISYVAFFRAIVVRGGVAHPVVVLAYPDVERYYSENYSEQTKEGKKSELQHTTHLAFCACK